MHLFKNRLLNIAISVSVLCHVALVFLIKPVFPAGQAARYNTSIAFLGDILENIGSNVAGDSSDQVKLAGQVLFEGEIEPCLPDFMSMRIEKKPLSVSLTAITPLELNIFRRKEVVRVNFSDFFIKGPAKDRVIAYKPDLGRIMALPSDFSSDFSANIRFRISKDGFVKYVECATSSGFSDIDRAAMRYVREMRFMPVDEDGQEGVVRVSFK